MLFRSMFNHGINILGLWMVIDIIERQTVSKKISELSGVALKAPVLTIAFVIIAFANIALPLTNAFPGEFMMFAGIFQFKKWLAVCAGFSIILAAVYMLNLIRKVFLGTENGTVASMTDISLREKCMLFVLIAIIFVTGVYPQSILNITKSAVASVLNVTI